MAAGCILNRTRSPKWEFWRKLVKRIVRWPAMLVGLLLLVALALPFLINPNSFRPMLESRLSQAVGREVRLGDLKLAIFSGSVNANDLSIAEDPAYGKGPFLQAKSLGIGVELMPLIFSRELKVTSLRIDQPEVRLIQAPSGEWNFSSLAGKPVPKASVPEPMPGGNKLDLSVRLVKITGGRFLLGKTGGRSKPLVLEQVEVELRDFSSTSVFPFSLSTKVAGGGEIKLDGKAGPINPVDVAMTPVSASLRAAGFDLAGSGWTQAMPGMGGLVSFDGTGESSGKTARVKGRLTAEKLMLAKNATPASRVVELDFDVEHNLKTRSGRLSRGDIHVGKASASLTGTYTAQGESTVLRMNLSGPEMPIPELAAMLPAMGILLPRGSSLQGGTAAVKLALEGPADKLITSGSTAFNNTTLAGFDLGKKMSVIEKLTGIKGGSNTEIQILSSDLRLAPDGMSADNIRLVVPSIGELGGAGTISPASQLLFRMSAKVHTSGNFAGAGNASIPILIEGTCSDPVFRPDVKAIVSEKAKSLQGSAEKAATGLLKGLLGGKKQN